MYKPLVILALLLFPTAAFAASIGSCGGPAIGTTTKTLDCGTDGYMVGLEGRGGGYVESIRLLCRKYTGGNPTGEIYKTSTAGKQNVIDNYNGEPGNEYQVVQGIDMKCGAYVDRIHMIWHDVLANGKRTDCGGCGDYVNAGGTAGFEKRMFCPKGQFVHKLVVKSGAWIDNITVYCRAP